jgi:phosphotriesterase-related protein
VRGTIEPHQLGVTLMHEHLLRTTLTWFEPSELRDLAVGAYEPITYENARWLRQYPYSNRETCITSDWRAVASELRRFKLEGGRTMVDLTSVGLGRDVWGIRKVADDVGVHIVAGTGYYVAQTHPWYLEGRTADELAAEFVRDITEGADGTDIRCGIIGEIGMSDPVEPAEWQVLEAAAHAHLETGAAISVHTLHTMRLAPAIIERLVREHGVHPTRVVIDHADLALDDWGYMEAIVQSGVFVEYDHFGRPGAPERIPEDEERIVAIERLLEGGYGAQLVVSQDLGNQAHMAAVGGCGYNHILTAVVPRMRARGIPVTEIRRILIDNPRRILPLALTADP